MAELFVNNESFDFISLKRLAKSYLEESSERIELPGFQRGAAWKAANVEALWDSLMRWFPIGSILLARANEFKEVKMRDPQLSLSADYKDINIEGQEEGFYILIDGQQRSNAIALGFLQWKHPKSSEAAARLWLDLGRPTDQKNLPYEFYLCTCDDPFGEGLTVPQKRQAIERINQTGKDDSEISLAESYPAKAKIPVPFAEFIQAVQDNEDWEKIENCLLQDDFPGLSPMTFDIIKANFSKFPLRTDMQDLVKTIREVILEEKYKIPAILFVNREGRISHKELYKLFERINVKGVVPPQSEMFFSALKLQWPEIGNFVAEISRDPVLEKLFRPTEIILAALRLVNPALTELTLSNFEKITELQEELQTILIHKPKEESIFHHCMRLTYKTLLYRGNGDYGLPRQQIQTLRKRVWHAISFWIYHHRESIHEEISDTDRLNIVRFALLDSMGFFLTLGRRRGITQYVNNQKFDRLFMDGLVESEKFPTEKIFQNFKKHAVSDGVIGEQVIRILSPKEYQEWIAPDHVTNKLNWNSGFPGNVALLFAQRDYLEKWESLNDLDKDHIIPHNWMNFTGPVVSHRYWKVDTVDISGRSPVINSPGNFRFWPSSLNRAYQDSNPESKYISDEDNINLDNSHVHRKLNSVKDILDASFIDDEVLEMIGKIESMREGNDYRVWTTARYKLFKQLVDLRCVKMYRNLYETLKFNELEVSD